MSIIETTYVINLKNRNDRWTDINNAFKKTGLTLQRWNAVNGKELSDDFIKQNSSSFCNQFCSPSMIGCWLSHYNLWKYIVQHKLDNVLILEDDAIPIDKFNETLEKHWKNVPTNWDIVFLGCFGSCDDQYPEKLLVSMNNKQIADNLIIPSYPLGLHAYMLSYNGAKKLVEDESLKKIRYHIDGYLASYIFNNSDKNINMFAFKPYLIYQNNDSVSDNKSDTHIIANKLIEGINATEQIPLTVGLGTQVIYLRGIGIPISFFTLSLFLSIILINFIPNDNVRFYTIIAIILYELSEIVLSNADIVKIKTISFELLIILLICLIFYQVRKQ